MLNELKSSKKAKIILLVVFIVLVALVIYLIPRFQNTFEAYNVISANYDKFDSPDAIFVQFCEIDYVEYVEGFTSPMIFARISTDDIYGEKNYVFYLGDYGHIVNVTWFKETGQETIFYDSLTRFGNNNVFTTILNSMIEKDWK